jgi:hypothetical protein
VAWLSDIEKVFAPDASVTELTDDYCEKNKSAERRTISRVLERLRRISNNHVGVIELADDLDIETVTEIFIRVNSAGTELSQADFAMSKIAVNDAYGGNHLRKAIDYFCHASASPEILTKVARADKAFAASEYFPAMKWLADVNDDIYDPEYTDMLRVAFTSEFHRGKLQDLVALLSGRNFETKQFEAAVAEDSFARLKKGVLAFMNQTHFERLTMILRSAGFITSRLIGGRNAVNFAYILYLRGRAEKMAPADLERLVRRWYVMSVLTGRYGGSPETTFDQDMRQIESRGLAAHVDAVLANELPDTFWTGMLPQLMDTSSVQSPYFLAFLAAHVKLGDRGFLSRDITVRDLILNRSDVHHIFPRNHLKTQGLSRGRYNQIANFSVAQSEINVAISDRAPEIYFADLNRQCMGGLKKYGGITSLDDMRANLRTHCIPEAMLTGPIPTYDDFLEQRRQSMALKIKEWYEAL